MEDRITNPNQQLSEEINSNRKLQNTWGFFFFFFLFSPQAPIEEIIINIPSCILRQMAVTPMHSLYPSFHVIFVAFKRHLITEGWREEAPFTLPNSKHLS